MFWLVPPTVAPDRQAMVVPVAHWNIEQLAAEVQPGKQVSAPALFWTHHVLRPAESTEQPLLLAQDCVHHPCMPLPGDTQVPEAQSAATRQGSPTRAGVMHSARH